jgi:hypothetical protein
MAGAAGVLLKMIQLNVGFDATTQMTNPLIAKNTSTASHPYVVRIGS